MKPPQPSYDASSDGSMRAPVAALQPVALLPLAMIAITLIVVAFVFMQGGNLRGFTAVQIVTRALPDPFWSMVTICGNGLVAFALLSPALTRQPRAYAAAIVAAALAGIYSNGFKHLFALPRPAAVLDGNHLHVIGETLRHNAFPSGHSVTAFTLAAVLAFASRTPSKTALWACPLATLVALSRIAVGAHWPADLAAGAAGGWLCGAVGVIAVDRWRVWNTIAGVRLMGLVSVGIGIALCFVDVGYPQAVPLQYAMALVAIAAGVKTIARPKIDPLSTPLERRPP